MYVNRNFKPLVLILSSMRAILLLAAWSSAVVAAYVYLEFTWLKIPWVPLTLVGIAVAFYVGFKNNSAYGRTWEARKVWGAIVNSSRTWGIMVKDYVTDEFATGEVSPQEIQSIHHRMVYRHIAWLYRLKRQLRTIKGWEHNAPLNTRYRALVEKHFPSMAPQEEMDAYLEAGEAGEILKRKNPATQLISLQSEELRKLKRRGLIDDFRHMEMKKMLADFYTQQGKCERIKNFPLPRQYATASLYFVFIFIALIPLGLLSTFSGTDSMSIWGVVPFTVLIGWVFWLMEMVGDYAENPFENLRFDTPMTSLTRTIEIDLREMLGETDLPEPITPVEGYVM